MIDAMTLRERLYTTPSTAVSSHYNTFLWLFINLIPGTETGEERERGERSSLVLLGGRSSGCGLLLLGWRCRWLVTAGGPLGLVRSARGRWESARASTSKTRAASPTISTTSSAKVDRGTSSRRVRDDNQDGCVSNFLTISYYAR